MVFLTWQMGEMVNLKELRVLKGLSQTELAQLIGTQQAQIHRWETGERKVPPKFLPALARVLGFQPADLRPDLAFVAHGANRLSSILGITLEPGGSARLRADLSIPRELANQVYGLLEGHYGADK
jgi:transcriptional regulator with XRE-family HTH domain